MRRALAASTAALACGCSLVFGIHDNEGPIDATADASEASADAAPEAAVDAAPSNGCPADAGSHTFCELFDEAPPWPDGGQMSVEGSPVLSLDGGCVSPPGCLVCDDTNGGAIRTLQTPSGASRVVMELHVRHDKVLTGTSPVPRAFWIEFDTGGPMVTFGVTFLHETSSLYDYMFWLPGTASAVQWSSASTVGVWYDVVLTVDIGNANVAFRFPPAQAISDSFGAIGISLKPTDVKSITFHAGMGTGGAGDGVSIDDVMVDVQ